MMKIKLDENEQIDNNEETDNEEVNENNETQGKKGSSDETLDIADEFCRCNFIAAA